MSESPTDSTTASTPERDPKDLRRVTLTRDSVGRYTARNDRGGSITLSSGTDELSPVELLLAGIAGCSAIDVDYITSKRAEPETFDVVSKGVKVKDEHGNHLQDINVSFRVRFPEGDGGDAAREMLPKLVKRSHDEWCTVSRTVEMGTAVTTTVE